MHRAHDWVPGTVHLVDLDSTVHARHAGGPNKDVVLVPKPSDDPDDPLNWSRARKMVFLVCLCVYILAVGIASAAIYSVLVPISSATSLTVADLNTGTGYMFLTFGWGCLIWQPMAQRLGKRPIYLVSLLATMAIMLWAPYATTNAQWIANKVIQGLVGAPIESLCEISISDVYFTHERGTYIGVYSFALLGSNFFAPLISGFINDGQGWQWVLYWCAIFCGAGFVICFLFMEETNYIRAPLVVTEAEEAGDEATEPTAGEKKEQNMAATPPSGNGSDVADTEAAGGETPPARASTKTWLAKMKLYSPEHNATNAQVLGMVTRPLILFTFPVVFFSGFMYGAVLCYFNVLNGTASLVLAGEPYNFDSSMVGLSYVSCVIGTVLGAWYSGRLGDKFLLWKARRNKGVMEAEHRLWLYLLLMVIIPAGLILWGVGAAHGVHWFGPVFAMGMLGASITIGCQLPIAYCIDAYKDLDADAMVTVICIRNTMSFAIGYGITPWVTDMGYQNAFLVAAFACLAQISLFFVFIKWGRRMREASKPRYMKFLDDVQREGVSHH